MNTDDLRLLWDCVTRFHTRWFPSEPQPRATQIKLLHEELGELTAAYLTGEGDVLQEAVDVVFVAFGMMYSAGHRDFNRFNFDLRVNETLHMIVDGFTETWVKRPGKVDYVFEELVSSFRNSYMLLYKDTPQGWAIAFQAVIAKNDAKTPEAGYRVNAGGKVTKS